MKTLTLILIITVVIYLTGCHLVYRGCMGNIKGVHYYEYYGSFTYRNKEFKVFQCREKDAKDTFPNYRLFIKSKQAHER